MSKKSFKKLALLGMTGGALLAAQTPANADILGSGTHVAGCGSSCGGQRPRSGGCGGGTYQSHSCGSQPQQYNITADAGTLPQNQMRQGQNPADAQVLNQLSEEGKMLYRGLDEQAKQDVQARISQDPSKDKNEIVKDAARRQADKRASFGGRPGQPSYQQGYQQGGYQQPRGY